MRPRTKILSIAALVLCGLIAWPVAAHYRLKAQLAAYHRQLLAQGEKLTLPEVTPALSSESIWAGNALLSVASQLRRAVPAFTNYPPLLQSPAPGQVVILWQQDPLPTEDVTNLWPALSADLALGQDALAQVHTLAQSPRIGLVLNYSQGYSLPLMHLAPIKGLAQWLAADTLLALHEHRIADACQSLETLVALPQHYRDEPLLITVLVRIAIGSIAASTTWQALQAPDLPDAQLQTLQQAWSSVEVLPQAEAALAMERVMDNEFLEQGRHSFSAISAASFGSATSSSGLAELAQLGKAVLDDPVKGLAKMGSRYPGYWRWRCWQSYQDEMAANQATQAALDALRTVRQQAAFAPALQTFEVATNAIRQAHPHAGAWLGFLPGAGMETLLHRIAAFEIQRTLALTAIALKRYHLRHGAYPAQLSALVPDLLPQAPIDPMDGKPLRYRLNPDGSFRLYSVGENGVDDGGELGTLPGTGLYKAWYQGRDAVWPAPASVQATQAYYQTLAAKHQPNVTNPNPALQARYGLKPPPAPATNAPAKQP